MTVVVVAVAIFSLGFVAGNAYGYERGLKM